VWDYRIGKRISLLPSAESGVGDTGGKPGCLQLLKLRNGSYKTQNTLQQVTW